MKVILIVICIFISPLCLRAQGVFGGGHAEVRDTLIKNGFKYITSAKAKDNTLYDEYTDTDGNEVVCYFNSGDLCYQFRRFYGRSTLIDQIEYLNKNFIKVESDKWVNSKMTTKVILKLPDDGDTFYIVSFVSMITKNP